MTLEEREKELNNFWSKETRDVKTQEWRGKLTQDEQALVRAWDKEYSVAMSHIQGNKQPYAEASAVKPETGNPHSKNAEHGQNNGMSLHDAAKYEPTHQEEPGVPATAKQASYKAFAYVKNTDKPKVLSGTGQEELVEKLQQTNETLQQHQKYTYCNIGKWNEESGKYEDYHKFDLASGRDISRIYLEIPSVDPDEFKQIIASFKEGGAKFQPKMKKWYITQDQADRFQAYIPAHKFDNPGKKLQMPEEVSNEYLKELTETAAEPLPFKVSPPDQKVNNLLTVRTLLTESKWSDDYIISLKDGNTMRISRDELFQRAGVENFEELELKHIDISEVLEEAVMDRVKTIETGKDYFISINLETNDNCCTVNFKDERPVIELRGDRFGVYFPNLSPEEVCDIVDKEMERLARQEAVKPEAELRIGGHVIFYAPVYQTISLGYKDFENDVQFVSGIKEISGNLEDIKDQEQPGKKVYLVKDEEGHSVEIESDRLYTREQAAVLRRAENRQFTPQQFDLLADNQFSPAQMGILYESVQSGMPVTAVAQYAISSVPAWQMDLFRYGKSNGLTMENVDKEINSVAAGHGNGAVNDPVDNGTVWEDCRRGLDGLIKENRKRLTANLKHYGFRPDKKLLDNMQKLKGMLDREKMGVKDVCDMYRNGDYAVNPEARHLIKELAKDFQHQELLRTQAAMPVPEH